MQIFPNIRETKLLLIASILALASCGQKGPLFLPGNPSEIRTEVPEQDTQADDDTDQDDDERPE
jgi:predicted small lipoprotein YifL